MADVLELPEITSLESPHLSNNNNQPPSPLSGNIITIENTDDEMHLGLLTPPNNNNQSDQVVSQRNAESVNHTNVAVNCESQNSTRKLMKQSRQAQRLGIG